MGITAIECAEKRPPFFDMLPMRALFTIANPDKVLPPTIGIHLCDCSLCFEEGEQLCFRCSA